MTFYELMAKLDAPGHPWEEKPLPVAESQSFPIPIGLDGIPEKVVRDMLEQLRKQKESSFQWHGTLEDDGA